MSTPTTALTSELTLDWEGAIRAAADLLVEIGAATADYAERCVGTVREHGPYIVVTPGLALVYAEPGPDTPGLGLAVLRLTHPVSSGHPLNDPVDLLFAFATPDRDQHLELLRVLAGSLSADLAVRLRAAADDGELGRVVTEVVGDAEPAG